MSTGCFKIRLTKGAVALVDEKDFEVLTRWRWCLANGRAARSVHLGRPNGKKKSKTVLMHREIMNPPDGLEVDHKNRDPLDNRRENLRLVTHSQNMFNTSPRSGLRKSKFPGVRKRHGHWSAQMQKANKKVHIGTFDTEELAHIAVVEWSLKNHGEFSPFLSGDTAK